MMQTFRTAICRGMLACLVASGSGCGDPTPTEPASAFEPVPSELIVTGSATATLRGITAECQLELGIAIRRKVGRQGDAVVYEAEWGGAVRRTVLDENGDGFSFWLHLHWPDAVVRVVGRDRVEVVTYEAKDDDARFYHALEVMHGEVTGPGRASGLWECAPLDIWQNGYVDTVTVAAGQWTMQPLR